MTVVNLYKLYILYLYQFFAQWVLKNNAKGLLQFNICITYAEFRRLELTLNSFHKFNLDLHFKLI